MGVIINGIESFSRVYSQLSSIFLDLVFPFQGSSKKSKFKISEGCTSLILKKIESADKHVEVNVGIEDINSAYISTKLPNKEKVIDKVIFNTIKNTDTKEIDTILSATWEHSINRNIEKCVLEKIFNDNLPPIINIKDKFGELFSNTGILLVICAYLRIKSKQSKNILILHYSEDGLFYSGLITRVQT